MKRSIALASVLVTAVATAVIYAGTGGSAAPGFKPPTAQQLAQHILKTRARSYLTSPALAAVSSVASGRSTLTPARAASFADVGTASGGKTGPEVRPQSAPPNVRVNDPSGDTHQTDQTTQSETTIAVAGSHVAVGFNDSQQGLLFLTPGADLSGYSYSNDGGATWKTVLQGAAHKVGD